MRGPRTLDSFGTILTGLARRLGLETLLLEHRLQREWSAIAGEPLASNTWPDQIKFKKLYMRVRNNVWMHHLTFLKPALIQKLSSIAGSGVITDIALRVGELPIFDRSSSLHPSRQTTAVSPPSPALMAEASAHASTIQDPDLRDRLAQIMAQSLSESSGPMRPSSSDSVNR